MLIYFDSVILIYVLDRIGPLNIKAANRLTAAYAAGDKVAVSDLSRLECRVLPLRSGDGPTLTRFDNFFLQPDVITVPLTKQVLTAVRRFAPGIDSRHRTPSTSPRQLNPVVGAS